MKHKHYDMIVAWAEGKQIQFNALDNNWEPVGSCPIWVEDYQYRIKPEPHPDFVKVFYLESNSVIGLRFSQAFVESDTRGASRIRCVFDGETTRLKAVELLQ
jgi:hypothetical protein